MKKLSQLCLFVRLIRIKLAKAAVKVLLPRNVFAGNYFKRGGLANGKDQYENTHN